MFKKVSWIVALLAALSLAVVFVGCGPEPEAPPPPEFEVGDVLFSLADWIKEKELKEGDELISGMDLDPIMLAGDDKGTFKVTKAGGISITGRTEDYATIDLKVNDYFVYFAQYKFELEVSGASSNAVNFKMSMPDRPWSTLAETDIAATTFTLTWEVVDDYPQEKLRLAQIATSANNKDDLLITAVTLTYLGPREE